MIIRSKVPLRLGLAGGGTDVSPFSDIYGGAILNATVNMYAYTTLEPLDNGQIVFENPAKEELGETLQATENLTPEGYFILHKGVYNRIVKQFTHKPLSFKMSTFVDAPPGSGLGTSSTLVVSILGAFVEWLKLPLGEYDIAAGYFATACVMLVRSKALRIAAPMVFAASYTLLLAFGGDYTEHGNFAFKTDIAILKLLLPANSSYLANPNHYTWFSTSLMFAAMTLAGFHATEILVGGGEKRQKAIRLFAYGAALEAVGWAVSPWIPVIKPIFTLSFTAQAMGYCVLALAVLYVLTDILMLRKGLGVVVLFGQCALTAYIAGGFFRPVLAKLADMLIQGFPFAFGLGDAAMGLASACVVGCELTLLVAIRRRLRR